MNTANKHDAGYIWVITRDALAEKEDYNSQDDESGTTGPNNLGINAVLQRPITGELFRIYDDDDILYYEGVIMGEYYGFEPLDDFGRPNAGATRIDYYSPSDNEWRQL